ncbi:polyribonucleotide nucleotidyltransferase [Candidatus Wolfebacteria bacterium]|nr:MAG: polyribonucleotide nucleotidyltransferase [Candidatus Wolfebacteria bacterium]
MNKKEYSIEIGGKTITARFSDLANQANGSVILESEDTVVLATTAMSAGERDLGFFNLTVDYLEKYYAAGEILGSRFMRREGRPSDEAILAARVIDRTIRPLFEKHIKNAIQVIVTVLSVGKQDPAILAVNAASLALAVSDIPWKGPVGAIQIGKLKGESEIIVNSHLQPRPNEAVIKEELFDLDLIVCGKDGNINMIEAMSFEKKEDEIGEIFDRAVEEISKLEKFQKDIVVEMGKEKKVIAKLETPEELKTLFIEKISPKMEDALFTSSTDSKVEVHPRNIWHEPHMGKREISELENEWMEEVAHISDTLVEKYGLDEGKVKGFAGELFYLHIDDVLHKGALENEKRADGRAMDTVRNIFAQAGGVSPVLHGSGIFYRGETHILSTLTLAGPDATYLYEGMKSKEKKHFMHHYNFPPYSAGETGRVGFTNRREIGHGMLAEKALRPIIPSLDDFPYTIRLVSESMASNGSTSQAAICGSTIALMDGGVPIKAPVAGIAMGLMIDEDSSKYKILTDIQGPEDHHGDMDFKVAGTREGVTALQLDIKVDGIPPQILKEALVEAKKARLGILDVIESEIAKPREDISTNAPKILTTQIKPKQIGLVIGSGGKVINEIREKTGTDIQIEDDGMIYITGSSDGAAAALKIIEDITHEYSVGEKLEGKVVKVLDFGAFVQLGNSQNDGMVHISEIAPYRVDNVESLLKIGDVVPVEVIKVDEKGRINLSIKKANPDFFPPQAK